MNREKGTGMGEQMKKWSEDDGKGVNMEEAAKTKDHPHFGNILLPIT